MLGDDTPGLLDLIGLSLAAGQGLEVDDLLDAIAGEDVVAALGAFVEPEGEEQAAEVGEPDVAVLPAGEHGGECFLVFGHAASVKKNPGRRPGLWGG